MKMRRPKRARMTRTDQRRRSARESARRGDPSNLSVEAFRIDRMRAYYRGRRPDAVVLLLEMRRRDRRFVWSCSICVPEDCACQLSAVEGVV